MWVHTFAKYSCICSFSTNVVGNSSVQVTTRPPIDEYFIVNIFIMGFDILTDGNDLMTPCLEPENDGPGFTASSVNKDNNSRSYVLGSIRLYVYLGYGTGSGTLDGYYKRREECWTSIHPSGQRYMILYLLSTCPVVWVIDEEVTIEAFPIRQETTHCSRRRNSHTEVSFNMGYASVNSHNEHNNIYHLGQELYYQLRARCSKHYKNFSYTWGNIAFRIYASTYEGMPHKGSPVKSY